MYTSYRKEVVCARLDVMGGNGVLHDQYSAAAGACQQFVNIFGKNIHLTLAISAIVLHNRVEEGWRMANRFKEIRKGRKMTQQQVADLLGITRQAYNHYESERRKPDTNTLRAIADVFGCSIDELLDYAPANSYPVGKMSAVPILGSVRAGYNLLANEECEGYEMVDVSNAEEYFCLNVTGDSMEPEIHSGDLALVHRQSEVESGDLAVVLIEDEEATIKRVIKSGKDIVLQPFNSAYSVKVFSGKKLNNLRILGKVVRTTRRW